jgi:hypothetical protein
MSCLIERTIPWPAERHLRVMGTWAACMRSSVTSIASGIAAELKAVGWYTELGSAFDIIFGVRAKFCPLVTFLRRFYEQNTYHK